jgi:hypothetical protein
VNLRRLGATVGPAPLWFGFLALLVAGPLLGSGYLLLLDWPSGPRFPRFDLFPLPSSGDIGNSIPLNAVHTAVRAVHPYLPDKLFLVAPILLGGAGMYRFVRSRLTVRVWGALYGGTLFVINPFVLDRYLAGHLHILLAYSLLPWTLGPLFDAVSGLPLRRILLLALWTAALAAVDLHVAGLFGLLVVVCLLAAPSPRRLLYAGATIGVGALLSAYWLLPALLTPPGQGIGAADVAVYATRPQGLMSLPTLAAMYGFWRDEFLGPALRVPALFIVLIPILGLAVAGMVRLVSTPRARRFATVLAVVAAVSLVLAAGTSFPPTAGLFRWLFDHVFFFRIYREPQKILMLVVLAYAVFGAAGLDGLARNRDRKLQTLSGIGAVVMVIAYGYTMLWGFWGQMRLSHYPLEWGRAERVMEGDGRLLILPWNLYAVWSFSDGRIVANPAPTFFSPEVLIDREAGFSSVPTQSPDPFLRYVSEVLEKRNRVGWLGHLLAPLDVRYVALLREVDHWEYEFVRSQRDLRPVYQGARLDVYENQAWAPAPRPLGPDGRRATVAQVIDSDEERAVTERVIEAEALAQRADGSFPAVARILVRWRTVGPTEGTHLLTGDRCTDGWRLEDEAPRCHLGAAAAFSSSRRADVLWRPLAGANVVGYGLSLLSAVGSATYVIRRQADEQ